MTRMLWLLFLLGAIVGTQVNRAIYRLAWHKRAIGPWSKPHGEASPRRWSDCIPIVGWFGLRREAGVHGTAFWVRPLLVELLLGVTFAALYEWEMNGGVVSAGNPAAFAKYVSHLVLLTFMLVATFIDFDEKMIPDEVTVPGTLAGLSLAALWPMSLLPNKDVPAPSEILLITSPAPWPKELDSEPKWLALAIGILVAWCLVLMPKVQTARRGIVKGVQYMLVSIGRYSTWIWPLIVSVLGSAGIIATWFRGGLHWQALFSSLVGVAGGGLTVWAVRIVASHALRVEAMGFGDVTLMAMIGSFLGWQPAVLVFFLAPVCGLVVAIVHRILLGDKYLPFGPYLCVAAAVVVLCWKNLWMNWAVGIFSLGWLIPKLFAACLVLMAGMLWCWRLFKEWLFGTE